MENFYFPSVFIEVLSDFSFSRCRKEYIDLFPVEHLLGLVVVLGHLGSVCRVVENNLIVLRIPETR